MTSSPENHLAAATCVICEPVLYEGEKGRANPEEALEPNNEEEVTYPEGGLEAWLVVGGSFCGM